MKFVEPWRGYARAKEDYAKGTKGLLALGKSSRGYATALENYAKGKKGSLDFEESSLSLG